MQTALQTAVAPQPMRFLARETVTLRSSAPTTLTTQCSTCHLKELCLPCGLTGGDVQRLDDLKFARRRVKEGEELYHEGDRFQFIYAVRSGTFKSVLNLRDGREQVTGFQMAGELLGLDGLASGKHASSAVALEDSEICAIPYAHLSEVTQISPDLHLAMSRLMSREIVREHGLMMLLGSMNAEQRLAAFLLNLSQRMKARGYSSSEFHLRMMRVDIGSYLGMKLETVSRTFTSFQKQGILEVDKKHVRIIDIGALQRVLDGPLQ
jgi:CRP/FNR family transcriptional regulator, anaerobic regulatory protein